ncbi:MAG: 4-(cytidine 5'-diphospho)-2-C-methyl-D-erythritol kinase [Gammaproteobacteria bacterium]|nr:4-(cytidine 5'-diphospho)-2-C-methyl-D-erythritol kinase [Gammaproteobacteria bacterium]
MHNNSRLLHEFSAPAKINLFLHVTGKRPNGYHEIETLFQFLDIEDHLTFEITEDPAVIREGDHHYCSPEEDLIIRAANLLKEYSYSGQASLAQQYPEKNKLVEKSTTQKSQKGARIHIKKRIPPGSGLGGGSSNAATTLIALNHLWEIGLSREQLIEISVQLGADVPVFLYGHACWATGIGEVLESYFIPEQWYCVAVPTVHVSTREVFSHPDLLSNHLPIGMPGNAQPFSLANTVNDLQAITTMLYPEVQDTLNILDKFGPARMSGSGSSVFLRCDSSDEATEILEQLPRHITGFAARGLNHHPLSNYPN